jgi:L-iditol 2-dehydrogenase
VIIGDATEWSKRTDGLGADLIIDAAGSSGTLKLALDLVRPNGRITKVGWGPQPLGFSLDPLVQKNITLQGSFSHNWPIWEKVITLLGNGMLDVKPIIGGVWPITQWKEAFEKMHQGIIIKSVLKPV